MNDNIEYTGVYGLNRTPEPCPKGTSMPEQKPVAWVAGYKEGNCVVVPVDGATVFPTGLALFAAPPKREWIGLTDDERESILLEAFSKYDDGDLDFVACATESKLKEKNHE